MAFNTVYLLNLHRQNSETALVNDLVEIDPARIASSSLDGFVNVWNVYTGKNLQRWKAHASPTKIVCTAKGYIVTGSLDANDALKLWNPNTSMNIKINSRV